MKTLNERAEKGALKMQKKILGMMCVLVFYLTFSATTLSQETHGVEKKPPTKSWRKFVGKWVGEMKTPDGQPFLVEIEISDFTFGKWCGRLSHPAPLDAEGNLLGVSFDGKTMALTQIIMVGRERCLDGVNLLTLIDDRTLERVWVDPESGLARDKGILKRR